MIRCQFPYFILETEALSYLFGVMPTGQLEHLYFGKKIVDQTYDALHTKLTLGAGSSILYERNEAKVFLDLMPLEYSGVGKGDFRLTPMEVKMPDGTFVQDFVYQSYTIEKAFESNQGLPAPTKEGQSLIITLVDDHAQLELKLIYTLYEGQNIIARKALLSNKNPNPIVIRKMMSFMLDVSRSDFDLMSFDGGWIKETHRHIRPLHYGTYVIDSTTGSSSNRHNPGIILMEKGCHEDYGVCIGINLMYSGNHYEAVQITNHGMMRVMSGINPHCFEWPLNQGESFETPYAILSYSNQGFNLLSTHFHDFVNECVVPKPFQKTLRPIVINSWEAFYFDFNENKLLKLAKDAQSLGIELFVLDDGWFKNRMDDTSGLGDYEINSKRLKKGLPSLVKKINQKGLDFGLWFEPEMVNPDSDLYRNHPEYAIKIEGRTPSLGRNQLVLDLCNPEVIQYIKSSMKHVMDQIPIRYLKWDMNRHITDFYSPHLPNQGMFFHRYILGLYAILNHIRHHFPDVLIETCSSGGNRFDLGMLSYGPQIWASDDTDPIERLKIQEGLSYLYPQSTISAHVSPAPHAQTLRHTPLSTRFNVASFGVLGYEYRLSDLSPLEKGEVKSQIEQYKRYREILQFGKFKRFNKNRSNQIRWQISHQDTHIIGNFQTLAEASPDFDTLHVKDLNPKQMYHLRSIKQSFPLSRFGHLISHALPIKLKHDGLIMRTIGRYRGLDNATESVTASGEILMNGYRMKQAFMGTGYDPNTRLMGDFDSQIYIVEKVRET